MLTLTGRSSRSKSKHDTASQRCASDETPRALGRGSGATLLTIGLDVASHKSQHFVPQHYLRGFSSDGRSVPLCHLKSGQIVPKASIKDQCSRDYFYGKDR